MINKLAKQIHKNAVDHGFFNEEKNIGEMLCLIHSEVSEALEADRKNKQAPTEWQHFSAAKVNSYSDELDFKHYFEAYIKDTFADELSDIVVRVLDLAEFKGIDMDSHISAKMRYNSYREYKHGKKY